MSRMAPGFAPHTPSFRITPSEGHLAPSSRCLHLSNLTKTLTWKTELEMLSPCGNKCRCEQDRSSAAELMAPDTHTNHQ
ncbi:hypothetical protein AVEN_80569-1 [Araneus ventricosus]|uniref:Uncharacterized protein n=1 Tax=Araneus ventricosus TaxID=182803 RepID=A0A4Y2CP95_ARAVE|nr:hypothetical protein AVEN_80569-1 [Araneus ventricosus]